MKKYLIALCVLAVASYNNLASAENTHKWQHKKHSHKQRTIKKLDKTLKYIIKSQHLTGDPLLNRDVPDIESPQAQLGMELFFSKAMSGNYDSACVACHHPVLGGGDNLPLPIGVEADKPDLLGPGRTNDYALKNPYGGPPVPRNAPTTFNVVAWDKFQFHDGRVESQDKIPGANGSGDAGIRTPDTPLGTADPDAGNNLVQAQARFPVTSNEEMKGFNHTDYSNQAIRDFLAERLADYDTSGAWLDKFRVALERSEGSATELMTEQNISMLISEYERSQAFVNTPWKKYVEGNKRAISVAAKKGALLFYTPRSKGGADCSNCHKGDFFTDEGFHNLAMPQIGPGKGDGKDGSKDFGRARETNRAKDMFAFRTPSLVNVEVTGPWSHAGAYSSLEAVVKHHLNAAEAIEHYDEEQLNQLGIRNLEKMSENTKEALYSKNFAFKKPIHLSDRQVGFLVEFLKTLTDPCTQNRECLGAWIPDAYDGFENVDQLNAIDKYGNLL